MPAKKSTAKNKQAAGKQADDVKAQMLAALEAKNSRSKDVPHDNAPAKQKANGPEVVGGAPKMHRRKSG
ncbi:DUF5302 family protein [Microlunatus sp. Gsoil 973]|uniref:DUF5302 family protein n=1 Tax=Microlunatus sp. Gsoil 973 TaxID=2672569 RepID=UPI0012B4EB6D|nr:DUF5302 family protein [Microlunatus sp. Gsoil 973]QGN31889.1 hypothetical protein GJV80_02630 [Microlunatus sp. Gsoil 973]